MSYATDFEQAIDDKAYVKAFEMAAKVQNGADMDAAMKLLTSNTQFVAFIHIYGGSATDISG